jgi:HlyD family secretion protein
MKRFIKILVLILVLAVFAGTLVFLYQKSRKKPVVYETSQPFITTIVKKSVVTGTVIPRKEIEIKPQIIGIIDEIYVQAGDEVKKGDLIARISVTPNMVTLNNAENRMRQATLSLDDARTTHERQSGFYESSFNDGHLVLQKDNPFMIKLSTARFELQKAELVLEDAQAEVEKQKLLLDKAVISVETLSGYELARKKAQSDFERARDNYQLVKEETLRIIEQDYQKTGLVLKKAEAEFTASRNNLQLIREGVTEENAEDANTLIRSTTNGMVLDVSVKEGNLVIESSTSNVGTTVAVVADMNDMIFEGSIDESEVGKIKEGMQLILTIGAIEKESFNALIEYIAPKGKKVSGAIQFDIRAQLKLKKSLFVRAGYSANADIVLEKKEKVLAVKEQWIKFDEEKTFVEVETNPQVFERKEIEVGLSDGLNIEVVSGLDQTHRIKIPK